MSEPPPAEETTPQVKTPEKKTKRYIRWTKVRRTAPGIFEITISSPHLPNSVPASACIKKGNYKKLGRVLLNLAQEHTRTTPYRNMPIARVQPTNVEYFRKDGLTRVDETITIGESTPPAVRRHRIFLIRPGRSVRSLLMYSVAGLNVLLVSFLFGLMFFQMHIKPKEGRTE